MSYIKISMAAMLLVQCSVLANAQAQKAPESVVPKVLSKEAMPRLCNQDGFVIPQALLGELALAGSINAFALPDPPTLSTGVTLPTPEARLAAWIVATKDIGEDQAKVYEPRLTATAFGTLNNVRIDLVDYLVASATDPNAAYHVEDVAQLGDRPEMNRGRVVEALFGDALGGGRYSQIRLVCTPQKSATPKKADSSVTAALRGKIDDLAIPRFQSGTRETTEAFGKASEAKLAYTDNGIKDEESVGAELALGLGWQITQNDALFGFVHYVQNSTETGAVDDDDDSKDVRAVSPGILYRHSIGSDRFAATAGATLYRTMDFAQDSRLLRARMFLNGIVIGRRNRQNICGSAYTFAKAWYVTCGWGLFAEIGDVQDAGRSVDLAEDEDDEYVGIGANVGFTLRTDASKLLEPFSLSFDYRVMSIVSGELHDPSRFLIELGYRIPDSNVSITLSRTAGENFETFQEEDLNKLSVGWKY